MLRFRPRISFENYWKIALEINKTSYLSGMLFILLRVVNKFECKIKTGLPFTGKFRQMSIC